MIAKIAPYWKFVVAVIGGAATLVSAEGIHSTWATYLLIAATALGVGVVRNAKPAVKAPKPVTKPPVPPVRMS